MYSQALVDNMVGVCSVFEGSTSEFCSGTEDQNWNSNVITIPLLCWNRFSMPHREHVKTFFALRKQWIFCLFVQVCELDIIFNFEKAYFILDEFLMGGEIQDTSKKSVLKAIEQADLLQEVTWASPTTVGDVFSVWLSFSFNFLSLFWGGKESVFYIIRTLMRKLIISTYYRKSVRKLCYRLMGAHATTEWHCAGENLWWDSKTVA